MQKHKLVCVFVLSELQKFLTLFHGTSSFPSTHEYSCFIEFIKRVGEKRSNARLAEHFLFFATSLINSITQEHEC